METCATHTAQTPNAQCTHTTHTHGSDAFTWMCRLHACVCIPLTMGLLATAIDDTSSRDFFFVCLSIFFLLRMMYRSAYKQRQQQQVKAEVNAGASQICAQRQYCNIFIYIDSICAVRTIFDLFIFLLMLVVDDFFCFVFVFSCNAAIFGVHIFIRQLKGTSKRNLIARPQTNRKMFHFTTTVYTLATNK